MIPRTVHQMWKSKVLDYWIFKKGQKSVQEHFKGWDYVFWDDAEIDSFLQKHYPRFYTDWSRLMPYIKKVDVSRYLILHHYGGVYADLDVVFKDAPDLYLEGAKLFSYRSTQALAKGWNFLGNAFMGSEASHPFWIGAVEYMLSLPMNTAVLNHTGPLALGEYYAMLPEKPEMLVLSPDVFDNERCQDGKGKAVLGHHCRAASWQHH